MIKQRPVYLSAVLLCLLVGCGGDDNNGLGPNNGPGPVTPVAANTALGMNEGSGTTLADTSGHGHTGTLLNGPVWVAGQATYGQALSFDGIDDAV